MRRQILALTKSVRDLPTRGLVLHVAILIWLVIGAPKGRQVSEERKKAFAKNKRMDSDFAKLVKEVLKPKEERRPASKSP
jgi:hypothetical protein